MNNYLVKLKIRIGEYEKHTRCIVRADNMEDAGIYAMYCESHDPDNLEWAKDFSHVYDMCGEFAYSVDKCFGLTRDESICEAKYLPRYVYNDADLLNAGNYEQVMILHKGGES